MRLFTTTIGKLATIISIAMGVETPPTSIGLVSGPVTLISAGDDDTSFCWPGVRSSQLHSSGHKAGIVVNTTFVGLGIQVRGDGRS